MKFSMPFHRRFILPYRKLISRVNSFNWKADCDEIIKARLKEPQNDLAFTYSLIKEVIFRCRELSLFDTQIATAYAMEQGHVAQLATGEGKTLAAVVTAISQALKGEYVHILLFNDYLVSRDYEENKDIFEFCGVSLGRIFARTAREQRKKAYEKKVLYITAKEAGFDYLRNFLVCKQEELLNIPFHRAIIDEADSILIDEAKNPLVLAGEAETSYELLETAKVATEHLKREHIEIDLKKRQIWLNEKGISVVEQIVGKEHLFQVKNSQLLAMIHVILRADYFYKRDREYIVKGGRLFLIDSSTGRAAAGRRFPDFLQRAIEMKEGLEGQSDSMIFNMMPLQFFLLHYGTLCGMTGTAWSSRKELQSMYGLKVVRIPPNVPCKRRDHETRLFLSNEELEQGVIEKVKEIHRRGQPILLTGQSVRASEHYGTLLREEGLECVILNARQDEKEAQVIRRAAEPYRITVSTNMAGRGVDIRLLNKDARNSGGLFVLSVGINRSRRIDDQLRGRAGRQGEPGESQFFVSLEQEIFRDCRYNGRNLTAKIQKNAEGEDAQQRYILEKYSVVLERHRQIITKYRDSVLGQKVDLSFLGAGSFRLKQQLLLYYINQHWADYLLTMEGVREGIHLAVIGNEDPIAVYQKLAVKAFAEMEQEIKDDVIRGLKTAKAEVMPFTQVTNTWTYEVDESKSQFTRFHRSSK